MRKVTLIKFNNEKIQIVKEYNSISECALDLNVVPNTIKNWIGQLVGYLGYTETQFGNFRWGICYSVDVDKAIKSIKDEIPSLNNVDITQIKEEKDENHIVEPEIEFQRRVSNNLDTTHVETNKFDNLLTEMCEIHQEEINLLNEEIKDLQDKNDRLNEKLNLMIIYLNKTRRKLKFSTYEDYITDKTSSDDLKIILENIFKKIQ